MRLISLLCALDLTWNGLRNRKSTENDAIVLEFANIKTRVAKALPKTDAAAIRSNKKREAK
jgi:hypothetical protein